MTNAEILAIREGLAKAQGWRWDAPEPKGSWRPLWPYRRGTQRKADWPDPFTDALDFVELLTWALKKDIDISLTCITPESSPIFWVYAKRLFRPLAINVALAEDCQEDRYALMRAGTLAIWQAVQEDESTTEERNKS